MKSVEVCWNLLKPFNVRNGKKRLEMLKKDSPFHYQMMLEMKDDLNLIYNDLLKFQGFITILKAEKSLYERRIEFKKQLHQEYSKEQAVLEKINSQLSILKEDI